MVVDEEVPEGLRGALTREEYEMYRAVHSSLDEWHAREEEERHERLIANLQHSSSLLEMHLILEANSDPRLDVFREMVSEELGWNEDWEEHLREA